MDTKAEKEILERIEELRAEAEMRLDRMEKLFKEAEMSINGHEIRLITDDYIYIEDCGRRRSITNDAELIIQKLFEKFGVRAISGRKIYYKDSTSRIDQIVVRDKRFFCFKSGTNDPMVEIIKEKIGQVKKYPWE